MSVSDLTDEPTSETQVIRSCNTLLSMLYSVQRILRNRCGEEESDEVQIELNREIVA